MPAGVRRRHDGDAAGQEAADQAELPAAELRIALGLFPHSITPNDEFFVRYHLSDIPDVNVATYKIAVGGDGANGQTELTLDDLKKLPAYEIVAVNQCRATGAACPTRMSPASNGLWRHGVCALEGRPAQDVLAIVGLKPEAIEITFNGADGPAFDKTPDFIESLPVWRAVDESTLIAYEMNGAPCRTSTASRRA